MPGVEYKDCMMPYEYEERASFFMHEARELSEKHPEVIVNMENNTVARLEGTAQTIANFARHSPPQALAHLYQIIHETEAESAEQTKVLVEVASSKKIYIRRFEHQLNLAAKKYGGTKAKGNWNFIKNAGEDCLDMNYRYSIPLYYVFAA